MTPYVESGKAAEANLRASAPNPQEQRLVRSLQGFEQTICTIGVFAMILTPMVGVFARSTEAAAYVAINFLAVIVTLDMLKGNVRKALRELRQRTAGTR